MYKLVFTIDGFNYPHIGYTAGRRWNGWATPFFEVDEAFAIMDEYNRGREATEKMFYDEETDTFRVAATEYTDADEWKGKNYKTEEGLKHLYGIGAYSWVWEDTTRQDIYDVALRINDFLWEHDTYEYKDQYAGPDEIIATITKQLQDFNVLKRVLTALYVEELKENELCERLGGILHV